MLQTHCTVKSYLSNLYDFYLEFSVGGFPVFIEFYLPIHLIGIGSTSLLLFITGNL